MNTEENKALEAEAECCESFQVHSDMVEAVKKIGLNQRAEIKDEWFKGREKEREMFWCRFGILKEQWKA